MTKNGGGSALVRTLTAAAAAACLLAVSCATHFSPQAVRREILRQTGSDPEGAFELTLGSPTMRLIKTVIGPGEEGKLPLAGLKALELAVYDAPPGGDLDFTRMAVRGWEPVIRTRGKSGSALVLIRFSGGAVGDLVILAGGERSVLYGRLKGTLSRDLPAALGEAFESEGVEALKDTLVSAATGGD